MSNHLDTGDRFFAIAAFPLIAISILGPLAVLVGAFASIADVWWWQDLCAFGGYGIAAAVVGWVLLFSAAVAFDP